MDYVLGLDVIGQKRAAQNPEYFLYDGHGSVRQVADNAGAVLTDEQYDYDAYGQMTAGPPNPVSKLRYTGEMWDNNLSMYNLRARWYDPANGRFNQMDPFAGNKQDPQSLHKYLYCHCNPINAIDPSGMEGILGITCQMAIRMILFSISVGAVHTAIQYGRGMRGWDLVFNFLMTSAGTAAILFGGMSSLLLLKAITAAVTLTLLACAGIIYGAKILTGTFDRWDAAEVLLFLLSLRVARSVFKPVDVGTTNEPAGDYVVRDHGTSTVDVPSVLNGVDPAKCPDGGFCTTPIPEEMPSGGRYASSYACNRANGKTGGDPVILRLFIPRNIEPSLKMYDWGDEIWYDPAKLAAAQKSGQVKIRFWQKVKKPE